MVKFQQRYHVPQDLDSHGLDCVLVRRIDRFQRPMLVGREVFRAFVAGNQLNLRVRAARGRQVGPHLMSELVPVHGGVMPAF